jgi:ubiquinone/menaquinone biosynthesis C-methylase UbiE
MFGPLWPAIYDFITRTCDRRGFGAMRHDLIRDALGATIEIGAGTGGNLAHYPDDLERLVLVEPDGRMLRRLRARAGATRPDAAVVEASAEHLPFPDESFDTAVVTFVLCTVPDPDAALAEIRRVLRPGGRLLLAEHVRSQDPGLARKQDRQRRFYNLVASGCNPNRDTLETVRTAGFTTDEIRSGEIPNAPAVERPLIIGAARAKG